MNANCVSNWLFKWLTRSVCFSLWPNFKLTVIVTSRIANTECLLWSFVKYQMKYQSRSNNKYTPNKLSKTSTDIFCFDHWSIYKWTQMISYKIYNTMCLLYLLVKVHLVKYRTQSVCLIQCSISDCAPNLFCSVLNT